MPSEVTRCNDCGAPLKGVPSWLATAHVKFACTNCPKRPSRAVRHEPIAESHAALTADPDLEDADLDEMDEEADLEVPTEEIDEVPEEA
jgi:hypothetical protein